MTDQILMYPGADEVGLTMLSRSLVDLNQRTINVSLIYRDSNYKDRIPNYEGQPLNFSVLE